VWAEGSKPCIFLPDDLRNPPWEKPQAFAHRWSSLDSFQSRWLDDDNSSYCRTNSKRQ
jgi:hypothetical protein